MRSLFHLDFPPRGLELLHDHHQHYSAPRPIENPHYLCLKTLQVHYDTTSLPTRTTTQQGKPDKTRTKDPIIVEHWFSIPKEK